MLRILALLAAMSLPLSVFAHDNGCAESKNELQCVLKSYPAIYQNEPEYFWKVLNHAREAALSCTSIEATAVFFRLVSLSNPGADLEEFTSESIENICVTQPICFKKAMGKVDKKTRMAVKGKLENPIYFETDELTRCYGKRRTKEGGSR